MKKSLRYATPVIAMFLMAGTTSGQSTPKIGIRGGVGTDINLGLAYSAGANYAIGFPQDSLELGILFFGGSFEETTVESIHTYEEKTDLLVFGLMANYLINYKPGRPGLYFVTGVGLASINAEWEERSTTDESLGTLLPGGGSMESEDGTGGGTVLSLGIGSTLSGGLDLRAELPVIVTFARPGGASAVVPTLVATLGYRF